MRCTKESCSIQASKRALLDCLARGEQAKAEQLQEGIRILDARLRGVVLARQGELMSQADRLREADAAMQARLLALVAASLNINGRSGQLHHCQLCLLG